MKKLFKALLKNGKWLKYLCTKFARLTDKKLKARTFDGPRMRHLLKYQAPSPPQRNKMHEKHFSISDKELRGNIQLHGFIALFKSLGQKSATFCIHWPKK